MTLRTSRKKKEYGKSKMWVNTIDLLFPLEFSKLCLMVEQNYNIIWCVSQSMYGKYLRQSQMVKPQMVGFFMPFFFSHSPSMSKSCLLNLQNISRTWLLLQLSFWSISFAWITSLLLGLPASSLALLPSVLNRAVLLKVAVLSSKPYLPSMITWESKPRPL